MILHYHNKKLTEFQFSNEAEFERVIVNNSKQFFGECTIYIDSKKKIEGKFLGGTIPDGMLFNLSDPSNPEFYLVEVELVKHDFYRHIFPQITKFFSAFKNQQSIAELVEKIFLFIKNDPALFQEFKAHIKENELYKFIKDTVEKSQNVLLILDGEKDELPEIMDTYSETWGSIVKFMVIKEFRFNSDVIHLVSPDFNDIPYVEVETGGKVSEPRKLYLTEEAKVGRTSQEAQKAFTTLKTALTALSDDITYNAQKYYLSIQYIRNIAYLKFSSKKFKIIALMPEEETRKIIKNHKINSLSESVQKFYNGPCCAIDIEDDSHIDEVIELFKKLIAKFSA